MAEQVGAARHTRQPSAESAGLWASRQSSTSDLPLSAIRASVLYGGAPWLSLHWPHVPRKSSGWVTWGLLLLLQSLWLRRRTS